MPEANPPAQVDDAELARRMAARDESALVTVLEVYGPKIRGYLFKKFRGVLDDGEREFVLNLAALNLWNAAGKFDRTKGGLRGWFVRIARNAAISHLRAQEKHRSEPLDQDPAEDYVDVCPQVAADEVERLNKVDDFINNLVGIEKVVAQHCFIVGGDPDIERLAKKLGKERSNIDTVKSKVKKKIRDAVLALEASEAVGEIEP